MGDQKGPCLTSADVKDESFLLAAWIGPVVHSLRRSHVPEIATPLARILDRGGRFGHVHDFCVRLYCSSDVSGVARRPLDRRSDMEAGGHRNCHGFNRHRAHLLTMGETVRGAL